MLQRVRTSAVAGALVVLFAVSTDASTGGGAVAQAAPATGQVVAPATAAVQKVASRPVLKVAPTQVEEGDLFSLSATIKSPARATRATLLKARFSLLYSATVWDPVKTVRTGGKSRIVFK